MTMSGTQFVACGCATPDTKVSLVEKDGKRISTAVCQRCGARWQKGAGRDWVMTHDPRAEARKAAEAKATAEATASVDTDDLATKVFALLTERLAQGDDQELANLVTAVAAKVTPQPPQPDGPQDNQPEEEPQNVLQPEPEAAAGADAASADDTDEDAFYAAVWEELQRSRAAGPDVQSGRDGFNRLRDRLDDLRALLPADGGPEEDSGAVLPVLVQIAATAQRMAEDRGYLPT